jgi:hypothetical protein
MKSREFVLTKNNTAAPKWNTHESRGSKCKQGVEK